MEKFKKKIDSFTIMENFLKKKIDYRFDIIN